ncbi:transcriptional regulator [Phyllobacterium endophyticum]|uniref:transcriptional regulator n=1 Tax=Phyllobacterium endophyticum TaxID=1149773 RepID=UPI0011C84285|nr:transcriptional regulator [Phyllobacterium endophyticum]TXR49350.1 transcriptional regulator [Phyllobacterium endophyticum]
MADFVAVLRKTIDGLADPTPALRQRVYAKARATIEQKLVTLNAPEAVTTRQIKALEDAIAEVESDFAPAVEDSIPEPASVPAPPPLPAPAPPPASASPSSASTAPAASTPSAVRSFSKVESQPDALEDFLSSHGAGGVARSDSREEGNRDNFPLSGSSANRGRGPEEQDDDELDVATEDRRSNDYGVYTRGPLKQPSQRRSLLPLLGVAALLLIIAGAGYAGWTYRDRIAQEAVAVKTYLANLVSRDAAPPANTAANEPPAPASAAKPAQPTPGPSPSPETAEPKPEPKLTQRLLPDGQEVNPGPANDTPSLGEGTSVATSTPDQPARPPATPGQQQAAGQSQPPAALPIGQKAFFYEERSGQDAGTADAGGVVWSVVQESPGNDLPPEPAIKAEVTIPDRGINLRMIIRRNGDKSLPASHLVEMIFTVPEGFPGGSIDNVSRMTFKDTEQAPGNPLVAIPAKIADNFFIIAMNDAKTAVDTNLSLIRRQSWIDIPIAYKTGRRALITLEKGLPGEKAFDEVLKSWAAKTGG